MRPAIFLDRDGVVIENRPNYVRRWEDVAIFPAAVQALTQWASSPYRVVFVTNQSAVGRGLITLAQAEAINRRLLALLTKSGCRVDGVLMCPHAPEANCACRKPRPGLLLEAARTWEIDLSRSMMIGDAWSDLQAGQAAGVTRVGLVKTGRGQQQLALPRPLGLEDAAVFDDLAAALRGLARW